MNLGLARRFGLPVTVVGDIDRGGVFAALFGTHADPGPRRPGADPGVRDQQVPRRRVGARAPVWRADASGRACRWPVCCRGCPDLWLDAEDTLEVGRWRRSDAAAERFAAGRGGPAAAGLQRHRRRRAGRGARRRGPGHHRPRCRRGRRPGGAARIPVDRERPGLAARSRTRRRAGRPGRREAPVLGICGGYQMLAATIDDRVRVRLRARCAGLGLLPVHGRLRRREGPRPAGRARGPGSGSRATRSTTASPTLDGRRRAIPGRLPSRSDLGNDVARHLRERRASGAVWLSRMAEAVGSSWSPDPRQPSFAARRGGHDRPAGGHDRGATRSRPDHRTELGHVGRSWSSGSAAAARCT